MIHSAKTLKQYENIYKIIENKLGKDVDYDDTDAVMNVIMKKENGEIVSDATLKNRLSAVTHKSKNKFYKDQIVIVANRLQAKAESPETHKAKEGDFNFSDLKTAFEKAEGFDKMLMALYFLNPPRRLTDYTEMTAKFEKPKKMMKKFNYLLVEDKTFVFNNYKTSITYGRQIIKINDELFEILKPYLKKNKPILVNPVTKKRFTDAQLSIYLARLTQKLTGKKASTTAFRHAYITEFLKSNPTTNERKQMSSLMSHDIKTQLEYDRRETD